MPDKRSDALRSAGHPHPILEDILLAILVTLEEIRDASVAGGFKASTLAEEQDGLLKGDAQ